MEETQIMIINRELMYQTHDAQIQNEKKRENTPRIPIKDTDFTH